MSITEPHSNATMSSRPGRERKVVNYASFYDDEDKEDDEEEQGAGSDRADGSADDFEPSPPKRVRSARTSALASLLFSFAFFRCAPRAQPFWSAGGRAPTWTMQGRIVPRLGPVTRA